MARATWHLAADSGPGAAALCGAPLAAHAGGPVGEASTLWPEDVNCGADERRQAVEAFRERAARHLEAMGSEGEAAEVRALDVGQ